MFGLSTYEYDDDGFRTCGVTDLRIHKSAEDLVKLFGVTAIVSLAIGGVFALLVAMTRWEVVGLLDSGQFYRFTSLHAWFMILFWMVFMEIAILYVGGPFVLGRKLSLHKLGWAGYGIMAFGGLLAVYSIATYELPNQAPFYTSYVPLPSPAPYFAGAVLFLVGAVVAAVPFFATIWREKRENPSKTLPLITFGAFITAVIALEALAGGITALTPAFLWRIGFIEHLDAAWYRQMFWTVGHGSQQINLLAMITVWYFMTHVVGGAEVASEKVSRFAFVLYLFFINMGAAHHLMSDPGVSAAWRMWNTSYAAYGAVIASMIHAFAIPAGLEAGRRRKGEGGGLFGWLWSAPWKDPGFSATILSIILFGFLGGITGVMMGQMQLNMNWHNTLAVTGHFHATVVTGTTLAFMGLSYYVLRLVFGRNWLGGTLASIQPFLYGGAMGLVSLMLMYLGLLFGVPRRHPSVMDIPGTSFDFSAAEPFFAVFAVAALLAIVGGALFVLIVVGSLVAGSPFSGGPVVDDDAVAADGAGDADAVHDQSMRGTFTLTLVFFGAFVVLYALNWFLLSQVWHIGP
ncbi:cytochrome c oxidase subunit I [Halobacterium bonnevillei]|uniref:Cytochrome C oxidase subunit I n=1 Tax=Halobacterium bonnevillei TaxID=2692200 RepID=A0A6B0SKE9_9EURY|nr:cbb3-type cytochrome c oxidase subunit I [Halobacterium bonnevillei]MXR20003.1 cytochrome C oxidase subunit I [Halobacterium bonnevillei]